MLVTDVGDEMCWRELWDDDEGFGRFCHQYPLPFKISDIKKCHQYQNSVTNIQSTTSM